MKKCYQNCYQIPKNRTGKPDIAVTGTNKQGTLMGTLFVYVDYVENRTRSRGLRKQSGGLFLTRCVDDAFPLYVNAGGEAGHF